jgi:hypothetical protein
LSAVKHSKRETVGVKIVARKPARRDVRPAREPLVLGS